MWNYNINDNNVVMYSFNLSFRQLLLKQNKTSLLATLKLFKEIDYIAIN